MRRDPADPATLLLLGRVHLAWPTVGRFRAWQLFEQAARLEPTNPEPRYQQVQVGLALGSADGERLARDAIFRILQIVPDYADIWRTWHRLYEGDDDCRRALQLLERFDTPASLLRRVDLLIRVEDYATADSLLAVLGPRRPEDPLVPALRAESAFETGDPADGEASYWAAVARSARDSTDRLWHQIETIASPEEERAYWVTPPDERPGFFRSFWAALWRALYAGQAGALLDDLGDFALQGAVLPGHSALEDELTRAGVGVDLRDLPEPDSITRYARLGFDGRGLIYLRFGEPQERLNSEDVEEWRYLVDGQSASLVFARLSGDFPLHPTSARELHDTDVLLERDASSRRATLPLAGWVAFFRAAESTAASSGFDDVVIRTSPDSAGVALWDPEDQEIARVVGVGPFSVRVRDGVYRFGMDAHTGDRMGSVRQPLVVPPLGPGSLFISSLMLAVTGDTAPDRLAMARAMPADLVVVHVRAARPALARHVCVPPHGAGDGHARRAARRAAGPSAPGTLPHHAGRARSPLRPA
jgi:hypothetical protein